MRAVRTLTGDFVSSSARPWLPGLPHALAGVATWAVFGGSACITGLLLATLASFVVYLPMTALALNGGRPLAETEQAPVLPAGARIALLGLWTLTAWGGAALAAAAG